jgi:hypothetical protein
MSAAASPATAERLATARRLPGLAKGRGPASDSVTTGSMMKTLDSPTG